MASLSMAPVSIFSHGADEEKAETARLSSFIGAIAIGDLVKSTLGPKGMDKILLGGGRDSSVTVTNDGATILKAIGVDNPAAKVLVDMSKVQDDEVGDGTTSVTVLAAELLRVRALPPHSVSCHFSKLAVEAVLRLKGSGNLEAVHVIKKLGGSLTDSYLDEGFLLDKRIGRVLFFLRQLIYNYPEQLFAAAGVMAIEHADFVGVERLALVTGGEISSTFDHPELVKLGRCKLIEEVMIGEDTLIHFSGVDMGEACTIVLRGATQQILDEAERSLHDALCVLAQTVKETRTVFGGGCSEMLMAKAVSDLANHTPGKEAVAMESFAKALRMVRHTHPYVH
ncbi:T-complex protein 1 subunit beta [Sinocyclocheilus rhinocerous]|uniref:T-complex protein 1 subunit beta n=1 Tax=Sinocyclocheilus rhinocerous TaxID=307959 RepID=UPI0007B8FF02|nr:PREDICTED: T-complex protein 1 subunit beta-like [Sinocyclocheilus rhinocerous]